MERQRVEVFIDDEGRVQALTVYEDQGPRRARPGHGLNWQPDGPRAFQLGDISTARWEVA